MRKNLLGAGIAALLSLPSAGAAQEAVTAGIYRGVLQVARFDISPPLRDLPPAPDVPSLSPFLKRERDSGLEMPPGIQDVDPIVQDWTVTPLIPAPAVSFDSTSNTSTAGPNPPDPVGDIGPGHYVSMNNSRFAVHSRTGTVLLGPVNINTLWVGLGGDCETDNSGDPIVIYDQIADRWLLSQFTASGPTYFNCVALSTSGDPTGTYFRWAFTTGTNFPDYPKYGMWPNAYFISAREFAGASFAGIGAYALNREQMLVGNAAPTVISFVVPPGGTPYNTGDGLLPADLDGFSPPPAANPHYWVGSMDSGGPYGAPSDALTLWKYNVDFVTPASSTFTLTNTIPIAAIDTMYPCGGAGRACIPQPGVPATQFIDILSYRQRPTWRLAYRNFGTHESLVTNQSVEAAAAIAGIRWWELRSPNASPVVFQEGTYAPGVSDGIHRWMGSIAMDKMGNMALGYSASDGTVTFPSVWYTGRLAADAPGTMPQGEGSIMNGIGAQTTTNNRWGDYSSMNVDPTDDCAFWYVNEYYPATTLSGWRLRVGSFVFPGCDPMPFFDGFETGSTIRWDSTVP